MGYLFAIHRGAKYIYDFDDDNVLKEPILPDSLFSRIWTPQQPKPYNLQTFTTQHFLFNPYPFFKPVDKLGESVFVWPRGFPLNFIKDPFTYDIVSIPSESTTVAVWQSLADNDPDVDAIYRMTQNLPVNFMRSDTVLAVPPGLFMPWNAQATLIAPSAFFGLILPISVTGRVSDIWRSFIASRLMWEADLQVAVTSPFVDQFRNPHAYEKDFFEEDDLYHKALVLMRLLLDTPLRTDSLSDLYMDIMQKCVDQNILGPEDYALAKAWVFDLHRMGFTWPAPSPQKKGFSWSWKEPPVVDGRNQTHVISIEAETATNTETSYSNATKKEYVPSSLNVRDMAVCISGQVRSMNMAPGDLLFPNELQPMRTVLHSSSIAGMTVVSV